MTQDLLPAFREASARVDDMAFGTRQLSILTKAVRNGGGTWDPDRAVEVLTAAGMEVTREAGP